MAPAVRIRWGGEDVELTPERAIHRPRGSTLYVADLHLGKAASFRSAGVPVPEATTAATLARLDRALDRSRPARLVILGDLIHARQGRAEATMEQVARWRARRPRLDIVLVRGNHDLRAGDPPEAWGFSCVDEPWNDGPFACCHEPPERPLGRPALCGHVHPAVVLEGAGGAGLRAPCFWLGASTCMLPAFGSFTGGKRIRPRRGDRIFVVGDGGVMEAALAPAG